MEKSKKAVEGEQLNSHQNELKKETTDPNMNKKPVVRKARAGARGISGTKNAFSTSSASKAIPASSPSKTMASGVINEIIPMDTEVKKETGTIGQNISKTDKKMDNKKSAVDNMAKGEINSTLQSDSKKNSNKLKGNSDSGKELKTLKKNTKKAVKKVVKLEKKIKKAKKKDVKKSTLQILKDKLLKAFSKLKRSNKKLKKVNK